MAGMGRDDEQRLLSLVEQIGSTLSAEALADVRELIVAGEPGVAFENLCTQLFEYSVPVSEADITELRRLGELMGICPDYWQRLPMGT
jgi:hypothetical protein